LKDSPSPISSVDFILFEDGHYRLCPTVKVQTDTQEFDALYERALLLEKAQRITEATAEYERAVELYRGEYLTENLYEDWTMIERERLANAYMDMLYRLATYYARIGQYQKCINACYRLLRNDPSHEDSYRLLGQCYVHLGLRDRALRQYRLCKQILQRKYNMDPSPETKALYRSLIRGNATH
jgi:LuxR family transcriptional regulator, maltose regulon positive regulatory protein